jgi:phosphoglycerate dehydrogenase-like enzyme
MIPRLALLKLRLMVTNSSTVKPGVRRAYYLRGPRLPEGLGARCEISSPALDQLREGSTLLRGQSATILGFGAIAARLVELVGPFGMAVVAMRRNPRGDEGIPIVRPDQLPQALSTADHVINVLPDNPESQRFVSAERLKFMKAGAIFYNIGRGTTVDQEALFEALRSRRLGAAWLDVSDPEPLPDDHPLWRAELLYHAAHRRRPSKRVRDAGASFS